ncbi:MAG: class I SAM-dependent methyltransferase [Candidatus Paceibacterota bacterium]
MKTALIHQLNEINARFYQLTATEFSKTRSFYWQGWKNLLPIIDPLAKQKTQFKVLDVGCGNGRFGEFLFRKSKIKKLIYHGLDNSQELLNFAEQRLAPLKFEKEFMTIDLVESLLNQTITEKIPYKKYHLATLFGILHHIPSQKLRLELIRLLGDSLVSGGFLVLTAWRFLNEKRFEKKQIHPSIVQIDPEELEENDYILDWQQGITAHRYCHYTGEQEMKKLIDHSGLELVQEYTADGKSGNLNHYVVLRKT